MTVQQPNLIGSQGCAIFGKRHGRVEAAEQSCGQDNPRHYSPGWLRDQLDRAASEVASWPAGKQEAMRRAMEATRDR